MMYSVHRLVVARHIVATPISKRMLIYLRAYLRNLPKEIKDKYEIHLIVEWFDTEQERENLLHKVQLVTTKDIVNLDRLIRIISPCGSLEFAHNIMTEACKEYNPV